MKSVKQCSIHKVERVYVCVYICNNETLLAIIRAQILEGTGVMTNGDLMNVYERRATNSLSFVHTDKDADTQGIENKWWPRTGTSKELFESNLSVFCFL